MTFKNHNTTNIARRGRNVGIGGNNVEMPIPSQRLSGAKTVETPPPPPLMVVAR